MVRGKYMVLGTADDVTVLPDSPMLAVEDSAKRASHGLDGDCLVAFICLFLLLLIWWDEWL
jgi:hypothetical protein